MVKGMTRRVIVIKFPGSKNLFDEAIFIVREDALNSGVTSADVVSEAQEIAGKYARQRRRKHIPAPLFALFGAFFTGLIWLAFQFIA